MLVIPPSSEVARPMTEVKKSVPINRTVDSYAPRPWGES